MANREIATSLGNTTSAVAASAGVPGIAPLVGMELRKLFKRPMTWTLYALIVALLGANVILGYIITSVQGKLDAAEEFLAFPHPIPQSLEFMSVFGIIFMAVLGAGVVGSEYGWGTMRVLVASGVPRGRLYGAKIVAGAITALGWMFAGLVVSMLASIGVTAIAPFTVEMSMFDAAWFGTVALMIARTGLVIVVLTIAALSAAMISRSLAAGIAVPVVWTVGEQIASAFTPHLGRFGEIVYQAMLTTNIGVLMQEVTFGQPREATGPSEVQALLVLVAYAVVLTVASYTVFRWRDLTAGG